MIWVATPSASPLREVRARGMSDRSVQATQALTIGSGLGFLAGGEPGGYPDSALPQRIVPSASPPAAPRQFLVWPLVEMRTTCTEQGARRATASDTLPIRKRSMPFRPCDP